MAQDENFSYWQLVSQGMDLEDRRLRMFVKHKGSLGTGRETIVRKFLADQTPEPYRVSSGFVVFPPDPQISSAQCDVLVYDPRKGQPLYRLDEFVVVSPDTSRLAIEVRSSMSLSKKTSSGSKPSGLDQVFNVHQSMKSFATSVFGFGFKGPTFDTFLQGIVSKMNGDIETIPECIVVHRRNYILIRADDPRASFGPEKPLFFGIDFGPLGVKAQGYATALFLWCYHQRIGHNARHNAGVVAIHARDMGILHDKLKVIRPTGIVENGYDRK